MKTLKTLLFLAIVMSIAITTTLSSTQPPTTNERDEQEVTDGNETLSYEDGQKVTKPSTPGLQGVGRFLKEIKGYEKKVENPRMYQTCNKNPRICRVKGSPGPDCCKKSCVNVMSDRQNCGLCGKRCKYNEMCCKGKCVNTYFDKKNCGGCHNKCKKGTICVYGMCNYA